MSGFINSLPRQSYDQFMNNMLEISNLRENEKFNFYADGKIGREPDNLWRSVRPWMNVPIVTNYMNSGMEFSDSIENLRGFVEHSFRYIKQTTFKPEVADSLKAIMKLATEALAKLGKRYEQQSKVANAKIVEAGVLKFKSCLLVIDDRTTLKYHSAIEVFLQKTIFDLSSLYPDREQQIAFLQKEIDDGETLGRMQASHDQDLRLIDQFFVLTQNSIVKEQRIRCLCEVLLEVYSRKREIFLDRLRDAIKSIEALQRDHQEQNRQLCIELEKTFIKRLRICNP